MCVCVCQPISVTVLFRLLGPNLGGRTDGDARADGTDGGGVLALKRADGRMDGRVSQVPYFGFAHKTGSRSPGSQG